MSQPFIGEIRPFAFAYAPRGWMHCDGSVLLVGDFAALFSILGPSFGGNGQTTFGIPNLMGRMPMHAGSGPGLTSRPFAGVGGQAAITLGESEMPAHNHALKAIKTRANSTGPEGQYLATDAQNAKFLNDATSLQAMDSHQLQSAGNGQPHDNWQPFLVFNYCLCVDGVFPSRN